MKVLIIVIACILALFIIYLISGLICLSIFNNKLFGGRTNDPNNPCYLTFDDYKDELDRTEFKTYYYVREINGFIYKKKFQDKFKGFVILSHGMFGTHIQYLIDISLLCENGYQVLAFDNYGCGLSEGNSIEALAHGTYVLENVIETVKAKNLNNGLPVFLYGHSWGGFSVLGAMRNYPELKGVISRSAPYSQLKAGKSLLFNFSKKIYYIYKPFLSFLGFFLLPSRMRITVKRGTNKNKKTPVLILQAKDDPMVLYSASAAKYYTEHPQDNVKVVISEKGLHNSLIEESSTKAYIECVKEYKNIKKGIDKSKTEKEFIDSLNKKSIYLYQDEVAKEIINFLNENSK